MKFYEIYEIYEMDARSPFHKFHAGGPPYENYEMGAGFHEIGPGLCLCPSTLGLDAPPSIIRTRTPVPSFQRQSFLEVTDLFCRPLLPTLFYRPEIDSFGDLMR